MPKRITTTPLLRPDGSRRLRAMRSGAAAAAPIGVANFGRPLPLELPTDKETDK